MSNYLAIATVSAVLGEIVQEAIQKVVPAATISFEPPEKVTSSEFIGSNIYLYRVAPNASLRSNDLATRRDDSTLVRRPQIVLDLYYVISFFGTSLDSKQLLPLRMLGSTVSALQAQPLLSRSKIRETILWDGSYGFLAESNLADQIETVKLNMITMNMEELSKLWTVFFQTAHRVSIAYQASVIIIDADLTPEQALPVKEARITTVTKSIPQIDRVIPPVVAFSDEAQIRITGKNFESDDTRVQFEDLEAVAATLSDDDLLVTLPQGLLGGVNQLKVLRQSTAAGSDNGNTVIRSNPAFFVLQPRLASDISFQTVADPRDANGASMDTIIIQPMPDVGPLQPAKLWLNEKQSATSKGRAFGFFSLLRFSSDAKFSGELDRQTLSRNFLTVFKNQDITLSQNSSVEVKSSGKNWLISDSDNQQTYSIRRLTDRLCIYFGFGMALKDMTHSAAFKITPGLPLAPGTYLVRLDVGDQQVIESQIQTDRKSGQMSPVVDIL